MVELYDSIEPINGNSDTDILKNVHGSKVVLGENNGLYDDVYSSADAREVSTSKHDANELKHKDIKDTSRSQPVPQPRTPKAQRRVKHVASKSEMQSENDGNGETLDDPDK